MRRVPRPAAVLLIAALSSACPLRPRPETRLPAPTGRPRLEAACARRSQVQGLLASGTLRYEGPEGRRTLRVAAVAERPDRLRLDLLSPLGLELRLVTRDGDLAAYVRRENVLYRARATPDRLRRYTHLPLAVPCLVDLLLGSPCTCTPPAFAHSPAPGELRLSWQANGVAETLVLDARSLPSYYERRSAGATAGLQVTVARWEGDTGTTVIPTEIRVDAPASGEVLELHWKEHDVNPTVREAVFTIDPPAPVRIVDVEASEQGK